jgi:hypothetical protein
VTWLTYVLAASPTYSDSPLSSDSASEDGDYATDVSSSGRSHSSSPANRSSSSEPSRSPSPVYRSSSSPSPARSVYDRTQCNSCTQWFEDSSEYDDHRRENDSGCRSHKECFPSSDNYEHARSEYHEECFVPGCDDDYEMSDSEVVEHVWQEHTTRG